MNTSVYSTSIISRSVVRQPKLVGSANKMQVRTPVPFLKSRYTSQLQAWVFLVSLSAGSHVLGELLAEYVALINLAQLSLMDPVFVQGVHD